LKRPLRRNRRRGLLGWLAGGPARGEVQKVGAGRALVAERLEPRVLLTTLVLPKAPIGSVLPGTWETTFLYADPEETSPGDTSITVFNEVRIGTLSGLPPEKDVVVELLDYQGGDISGTVTVAGQPPVDIGGGPGGAKIIDEVPPDTLGGLGVSINALASAPDGETYGITSFGWLVHVDRSLGVIDRIVGAVVDTDNVAARGRVVTFTGFDGADFDPTTGKLYAVAVGPTAFDGVGNVVSNGEVLITIDKTTGEAEAAGRNESDQADYHLSQITAAAPGAPVDLRTIVYQESGGLDRPVFLGFDATGADLDKRFVLISVVGTGVGAELLVNTVGRAPVDPADIVEGLAYANDGRLLGLRHSADNVEDGELVLVNLDAPVANRFTVIVAYGDNPSGDPIVLTGMSWDVTSDVGYATDPLTGTLYKINVSNLQLVGTEWVLTSGLADVYTMYIASSTADVYITVTHLTIDSSGAIAYQPTGGAAALLFTDEDNNDVTTGNAGGAMIGTIPQFRQQEIFWSPGIVSAVGTFFNDAETAPNPGPKGAYPGGAFRPGIWLARTGAGDPDGVDKPQHIGKIAIGGGVFGDVRIEGSIDTFYAGFLGTNNFIVEGDLNQLAAGTQAGGVEESDGSWTAVASLKYGGTNKAPVLDVRGRLGSFYGVMNWGLPTVVQGRSDAPEFPGVRDPLSGQYVPVYREIERLTAFETGGLGQIVRDDSPYLAQYVGSPDGQVRIIGEIEGPSSDPANASADNEDYYSFALLAGQTVQIDLYDTYAGASFYNPNTGNPPLPNSTLPYPLLPGGLQLFDPDNVLVANSGEADVPTGALKSLTYTAERAGIYSVAVNTVSGGGISGGAWPYRLDIAGLTPTTMGGGNAPGSLRTDVYYAGAVVPNVQVAAGNLGALSSGSASRAARIKVDQGGLGAWRAGANALPTNDIERRIWTWTWPLPSAADEGFSLEISDSGGLIGVPGMSTIEGTVGQISSPSFAILNVYAKGSQGNICSIQAGANVAPPAGGSTGPGWTGIIAADGNIGEVRIEGDLGLAGSWMFSTAVLANADGTGAPGVIDRLYVGGATLNVPVSVGARGGNVRFADVRGAIFHPNGGVVDPSGFGPFEFDPGQGVRIVDDSGVMVRLSPGYTGVTLPDFLFPTQPPTGQPPAQPPAAAPTGGVVSVKLLPVYDITYAQYIAAAGGGINRTILGYAITEATSTDGVRVTSTGGPAEIGRLTAAGVNDGLVSISGPDAISVLETTVSGTITEIVNSTPGGDLVAVVITAGTGAAPTTDPGTTPTVPPAAPLPGQVLADSQPFNLIRVAGHLGRTRSSTGQPVETVELVPAGADANATPGGSQVSGLVSAVGINQILAAGSLGDANITGDVYHIGINTDDSRAPGQFDGVDGALLVTGNVNGISLGDGIRQPGTGLWAKSGVFITGTLHSAEIHGSGHDIHGPLYAQTRIDQVRVSDGARIVGFNGQMGSPGERVRGAFSIAFTVAVTAEFDDFELWNASSVVPQGGLGVIDVRGAGSEIREALIVALSIDRVLVTGGANGIFDSRIYGFPTATTLDGVVGEILVGGQGIFNTVIVAERDLGRITVLKGGKIEDSEIRGAFHVGTISADEINRTDIDAHNQLDAVAARGSIFDLVIEAGRLDKLMAGGDILGSGIYVGGPVGSIQARGKIISTIAVTGPYGDLKPLQAGGDIGTPTGGIIIVDGRVGTIQAGGDFQAKLLLNWEEGAAGPGNPQGPHAKYQRAGIGLGKLQAGGSILGLGDIGGDVGQMSSGGSFGVFGSRFGVHGNVSQMSVGSSKKASDLESSVSVTGNMGALTVYGSVNGQLAVAKDLRSVSLKGSAAHRADLNASITVGGDFSRLTITGGDIAATDVVAGGPVKINVAGQGPKITIKGSDIAGTVIVGGGDDLVIDGSITGTGRYLSTGDVTSLEIKGDIAAGGVLDVTGNLGELIVNGAIFGTVHVTGSIGKLTATNILDGQSIVTAGANIGEVSVSGLMRQTYVLAGFEPGAVLAGDTVVSRDALLLGGTALAGDIDKVTVGTLNESVIAAGVRPGGNVVFGDLDGSDAPGAGLSHIGKVTIGQAVGEGDPFGVFADSGIGSLQVDGKKLPTPVYQASGFRAWTVSETMGPDLGGFVFQQGVPFKGLIGNKLVTVSLAGPGVGEVLPSLGQIGAIQLRGTTGQTKVSVSAAGADAVDVGRVFTTDDGSLGQLALDGRLANGTHDASLRVGGGLTKLQMAGIGAGGTVAISGSVSKAELGSVAGAAGQATSVVVQGGVVSLGVGAVGEYADISAAEIGQLQVRGDLAGSVHATAGGVGTATIGGNLTGVLSAEGDIGKAQVRGLTGAAALRPTQGVRAGGDIGSFSTAGMYRAVVAAGGELGAAAVRGDVQYSTLAAGLDIGPGGVLYDYAQTAAGSADRDTARSGDLRRVRIGGDLVQSNLTAALAPGADGRFGTGDDLLESRNIEAVTAPRITEVRLSDADLTAITVQFQRQTGGVNGNIESVAVQGQAVGSPTSEDQYAIAAAGHVESVLVDGEAFQQAGNVRRLEINDKDIDGSTIAVERITAENCDQAAFQVFALGLDGAYDVPVCDTGAAGGAAGAWVTFDAATNTATFHKRDGFAANRWGTNYYQLRIDATKVDNRQGVSLDGEFTGRWPTGDGRPGGDLVYYFAVGDLGGTTATAFAPFAQAFPTNVEWQYGSALGDNPRLTGAGLLDESDLIRLNGLQKGQILNVDLAQAAGFDPSPGGGSGDNSSLYVALLWREVADNLVAGELPVWEQGVRPNIKENLAADEALVRGDLLAPALEELAYDGAVFYGYTGVGGEFIRIDPATYQFSLLRNTLDDLNRVATGGLLLGLKALGGHGRDALWAVGTFLPDGGSPRESLVLIEQINQDVANSEPTERARVTVSATDLSTTYGDLVGLAELHGVLYGVDGASGMLVRLKSDPQQPDFGQATAVGSLGEAALRIAGLAASTDGTSLIALHDQAANDFSTPLVDALYEVDPQTGRASLLHEFGYDADRHGLATRPSGPTLVGVPLYGSPVGDTVQITFADVGPEGHVFGESTTRFSRQNVVISDATLVPLNAGEQEFVGAGYYYAFDVEYAHGSSYAQVLVEIDDIEWLNATESGNVISAVTDDPANVQVYPLLAADGTSALQIVIDAANGDGNVRVYFGGTSSLEVLQPAELVLYDQLLGHQTRRDMSPVRDTLVPGLTELTVHSTTLLSEYRLDLTDALRTELSGYFDATTMDALENGLNSDLYGQVVSTLYFAGAWEVLQDFLAAVTLVNYNAVGYDAGQELFVLASTETFDVRPLTVDANALTPDANPDNDVPLTPAMLSDLYTQVAGDTDADGQAEVTYVFWDIRGLEFRQISPAPEPGMPSSVDDLYLVATVTATDEAQGTSETYDALLAIGNILYPGTEEMRLAAADLDSYGFTNVRTLAYGNVASVNRLTNGRLYAMDADTETLLELDARVSVPRQDRPNGQVSNPNFGKPQAVGGETGNLGDGGQGLYEITSLDLAYDGRLYGIEAKTHQLVEIIAEPTITRGSRRVEAVLPLPGGADYTDITFDVLTGYAYLVRSVTASPVGDTLAVSVNGGTPSGHVLGGSATQVGGLTVSSGTGNDAASVRAAGGYYRLDVQYALNQGDLEVTFADIDWLNGLGGRVDSVAVSDSLNVRVETFGDDSIQLRIRSNHTSASGGATDTVTVYFGATADAVLPYTPQRTLELAGGWWGYGALRVPFEVPDDGNYLLEVTSDYYGAAYGGLYPVGVPSPYAGYYGMISALGSYDLKLEVFDDGNSDFGTAETASGLWYEQVTPGDAPVNLAPLANNTDLAADPNRPNTYHYNPHRLPNPAADARLAWPITVSGTLLAPGEAGAAVIDARLENLLDVDVYTFQLTPGQRATVDLDAEALLGRDNLDLTVGVYNGDFEATASLILDTPDVMARSAAQKADDLYSVQAVFEMPRHEGVVLDPQANGVGTYYVVVSGYTIEGLTYPVNEASPYRLTITTTGPEPVAKPPSQLVWLDFEGGRADYLINFGVASWANRPAFDAGRFGLGDVRDGLIAEIARRIEAIYRTSGLGPDELAFTTEKPADGAIYSTVIFGGRLVTGLLGIAETIDRHNANRQDMTVVLTDEFADIFTGGGWYEQFGAGHLSDDPAERFDQVATLLSNTGAHEMGHILGLEHATEINTTKPDNLMGYNDDWAPQHLEERNSYRLFAAQQGYPVGDAYERQLGFENEIDLLLRSIGSGTPMGI